MRVLTITVAIMSLVSCGEGNQKRRAASTAIKNEPAPFPADDTSALLNGELVEVPRTGGILWNGQQIDAATFSEYLIETARISRGNGRVVVQFEPGTQTERLAWVRSEIVRAGFCKWHSCAEARWKAVRPVVY
jgi:hypothetical protein